ncbi:uncharacterized protein [Littorina saxatilis]|uniref:Uncharacterized protein n=1 Tax=Littorina saxatilis TaxID=31220 RepID=A0AAN9GDH4_9CAEN
MDSESPVSVLPTAQLVTYLGKLGISRAGLDSVWEKEVTGGMLCEFCEEDIRDVFTEFKDRFRVRKLLRDLADKPASRLKPAPQSSGQQQLEEKSAASGRSHDSPRPRTSPSVEAASSALMRLSSSEYSFSGTTSTRTVSGKHISGRRASEVIDLDDVQVKSECEDTYSAKRQRVEDALGIPPHIPAAHSYNLLQSSSGLLSGQHSAMNSFLPPSPLSVFLNKPEFHPAFGGTMSPSLRPAGYAHSQDQQRTATFSGGEDQALCLKKSPQRPPSAVQVRRDTASPTTQPSSTTPDYLGSLETRHLDLASVLSMGQLATKYTAQEILSKKSQRSRPNGAQKLGSILIRNAAQQANLWSDPPHLRSISQPQRQEFLNSVYRIAPHIRDYEHLLWQRLSETLQNRRKYLLDKKLGKRGFPSSGQSAASSSSSQHDLGDFSEWQVTSMQGHLGSMGEDSQDDVNILKEVVAAHAYSEDRPIKQEPLE